MSTSVWAETGTTGSSRLSPNASMRLKMGGRIHAANAQSRSRNGSPRFAYRILVRTANSARW